MPRTSYTAHFKERTGSTGGEEPLYLMEIVHEDLAVPIRVVNDTQDLVHLGNTYTAYPFEISLPEDMSGQLPRAQLRIDNTGRELTQWIDSSLGGRGAQVTVKQVVRDTPDVIEYQITCDLMNVVQTIPEISSQLGYDDVLNMPGLVIQHRPDINPGIF